MKTDGAFYVAAPPERLPLLPVLVRSAMRKDSCSLCGCEVWVNDRGFAEAMIAVPDVQLVCGPCSQAGTAEHRGSIAEVIVVPSNQRRQDAANN